MGLCVIQQSRFGLLVHRVGLRGEESGISQGPHNGGYLLVQHSLVDVHEVIKIEADSFLEGGLGCSFELILP